MDYRKTMGTAVEPLSKPDLQDIVSKIVALPTLPQLARQIALMVDDPKSSAAEVGEAIRRDPATAARILRLVNSAYYGLTSKVKTVQQAVSLLGFQVIRSIAVSTSLPSAFKGLLNTKAFSPERFWKHSLLTACLCKSIAKKCKGIDPEAGFDVGLLHDIGKLVMACFAAEYVSLTISSARSNECSYDSAERQILNTTHGAVGAWLAERWNFPDDLQSAIKRRHDPCACEEDPLIAVLQFANCLCKAKGYRCSGSYEKVTISGPLNKWLHKRKWNIAEFFASVDREVANSKMLLSQIS
ncbi:MAG: HDOD domain-containing protein [Planctomycetes bacterium]|nr:HDOD domain-containing protein [Planctomycetota bacterium]